MADQPLRWRLWGKAPDKNVFTPTTYSFGINDTQLFIQSLNDLEHGWILVEADKNPNKLTAQELVNMAIECVKLARQNEKGGDIYLCRDLQAYSEKLLRVNWGEIGYIDAPKKERKKKEPKVNQEALERAKQVELELATTIPAAVVKIASEYRDWTKESALPAALLKMIEKYYRIERLDGMIKVTFTT